MANFNFYITPKQCKEQTKDVLRGSYKQAAKITAIFAVIMIALSTATTLLSVYVKWWISIPMSILTSIVYYLLVYGYNVYCLNLVQGKQATVSNLFAGFGRKTGTIIKLTLKRFFLSLFWFLCLFFPVIIKNIGYTMSNLMIADNPKYNGSNALKESKHLMKQNYLRYVKFVFSFFGWYLLSVVTGGIALLWVGPIFVTNKAMFYENLKTAF